MTLSSQVWGSRIVSESTMTSRLNAARKAVGDSGEAQRLIRTVARKGFRFVGEVTDPPSEGSQSPQVAPDRASIAVLPFDNRGPTAWMLTTCSCARCPWQDCHA